jgi:hypothetical protein
VTASLQPHVRERAAELLGRGWSQRAVCAELGVSRSSITRLRRDPSFRAREQRAREAQLEDSPTARAILEAGLRATDARGHPDWPTRTRCALALLDMPEEPPDSSSDRPSRTVIYVHPSTGEVLA